MRVFCLSNSLLVSLSFIRIFNSSASLPDLDRDRASGTLRLPSKAFRLVFVEVDLGCFVSAQILSWLTTILF